MALPSERTARLFYRSAHQRFADAQLLLRHNRTTGAVYLGGYSVECVLKAMLLQLTPVREQNALVREFRGVEAHDFQWLRAMYRQLSGPSFPRPIVAAFVVVNTWSTALRYEPAVTSRVEADRFMSMVRQILDFADGRL